MVKERVGGTGRSAVFLPDPPLEASSHERRESQLPSLFSLYIVHTSPLRSVVKLPVGPESNALKLNLVKDETLLTSVMVRAICVMCILLPCVICIVIQSIPCGVTTSVVTIYNIAPSILLDALSLYLCTLMHMHTYTLLPIRKTDVLI